MNYKGILLLFILFVGGASHARGADTLKIFYDINKYELSQYFREMNKIRANCKFSNCLHINEPGCAVIKAVEEGDMAMSRYESYFSIFNNEASEEKKY